jgi:hypothetical protein
MPLCSEPLLFWVSLIAAAALGCASGGQSFDDGSGDLGHGKRSHVDVAPHASTLAEQPSTLIRAPFSAGATWFDPSSGFVGDLDGDGAADFALFAWVGSGGESDPRRALAYVFYGRSDFPAQLSVADADFVIHGVEGQLTRLGDFNGDGFDDLGFAGEGAQGGSGRFDVLLGGAQRRSGTLAARTLETSFGGSLVSELDRVATASAPGDLNGDGYADLLLGSSLIFGRAEPYGQVSLLAAGVVAATLGSRVSATSPRVGDLDGDGYDDLLLNAEQPELFYGRADWGAALQPITPDAVFAAWSLLSLGDWDGDGYGDLAAVSPGISYAVGEAHDPTELSYQLNMVYGGPQRFRNASVPWQGTQSFLPPEQFALGDVNGDQYPDLILGEPYLGAGAVFLVPSGAGSRPSEIRLADADAALRGQAFGERGDSLGKSVSSGGDVDGDGTSDVLVVRDGGRDSVGAMLILGGQGL